MSNTKIDTRIYSKDKKLWVGITREDVYKDKHLIKVFSLIDADNSGFLSQGEIDDYNYVISDNKEKLEWLNPNNNCERIYPGKKFDPERNNEFMRLFRNIDKNCDKEISEDEYNNLKQMMEYKKEYEKEIANNSKLKKYNNDALKSKLGFTLFGITAGIYAGMDAVSKNPKLNFTKKIADKFIKLFSKQSFGKLALITGLVLGSGAIFYTIADKIFPIKKNEYVNSRNKLKEMNKIMPEIYETLGHETSTTKI